MELKNKGILFSLLVLVLVVLAGCTTAPKNPENPYLGYVYLRSVENDSKFKQDGVSSQLKGYMEQIASEELLRRQMQFGGIQSEKSLEKMANYVDLLEEPITIEKNQWKAAADNSLSKKEKDALMDFWDKNQPFSFDGRKVLDAWVHELNTVSNQLLADTRAAEGLESDIEGLRKENRYRDALEKVEQLRPYKSEQADELVKNLKKEASEYWVGMRTREIRELSSAKMYDDSHEQQVLDLYDGICEDIKVFGNHDDFTVVFMNWQDLLGENWRRRIERMGGSKAYWEAYGFAQERYELYVKSDAFAVFLREGLRVKIGKGYLEILDDAIRHYSTQASDVYNLKSLGGKAYVYCCMAKEMYDFVAVAKLGYNEETEEWYNEISEFEKGELVDGLGARLARRLIIHDFDLDTLMLSKKFRQFCRERYAQDNNHAWGLEVVTDKVELAQLEAGSLLAEPNDYVVEWSEFFFKVKDKPRRSRQKFVFVNSDRINLIDNPNRRDKSSEFYKLKQVKAQEVDQYLINKEIDGIDLSCNMKIVCRHRGLEAPFKMAITERRVKGINAEFGSVTNMTSACSLVNVMQKTKYYKPDTYNNTILSEKPPLAEDLKTILDEDMAKELMYITILAELDEELEGILNMYPIELLADSVNAESSQYLDTLGTILFYVTNLSATDAAKQEAAGKGYKWLHLRNQIEENMTKWCGTGERWETIGSGEKAIMKTLWGECVELAKKKEEPGAAAESE